MIGLYPAELLKRGEDINRACQEIEAEAPELTESVFEGEPSRSNSGGFLDLAYLYPYLFQAAFSEVDETVFENLAIAGRLYHEHIMAQDKFFDKDLPPSLHEIRHLMLRKDFLHEKAILILSSFIPFDSDFWSGLREFQAEFNLAQLTEAESQSCYQQADSIEEFEKLAKGKGAIFKAYTRALCILSDKRSLSGALERSQDYWNIGYQLFDDLKDWKTDYASKQLSWMLKQVLIRFFEISSDESFPVESEIGAILYHSGFAEECLMKAMFYFEKALTEVDEIDCPLWKNTLIRFKQKVNELRLDINNIRGRVRAKKHVTTWSTDLALLPSDLEAAIEQGCAYLMQQASEGYKEAEHTMFFPHWQGFTGSSEFLSGKVFQQATIVDALIDCAPFSKFDDFSAFAKGEIDSLFAKRYPFADGGWNYFPALPELPPDLDDLAIVAQVVARAGVEIGNLDIKTLIDRSIDLLIMKNCKPDGSMATWLFETDDSLLMKKLIEFIESSWGSTSDAEVIANMVYALYLWDDQKYSYLIERSIEWLARAQKDGSWAAEWYWGSEYPAFVCARALSLSSSFDLELKRASSFLLQNQHSDGSWGESGGNSQGTALSLLALAHCFFKDEIKKSFMEGLRYLLAAQDSDGSWEASRLIRMQLGRNKKNEDTNHDPVLEYQSVTMSTAYCVKALAAGMRVFPTSATKSLAEPFNGQ